MRKIVIEDKFENLIWMLYSELELMRKTKPANRGFIGDEMNKLKESLDYSPWHCKVGAQRILLGKDNLERDILYSSKILELAREINNYEN